jgi:hypothetical protein
MRVPDGSFIDAPDPYVQIILPAIVVEGSLYACFLNLENEAELTPIDRGILQWPHPTARTGYLLVNVLTAGVVTEFAREAQAFRRAFGEEGYEPMQAMVKEWLKERADLQKAKAESQ